MPGLFPAYGRLLHRMPPARPHAFFYQAETTRPIVALTFDDGPLRRTPRLINLLHNKKTPATFFLLASRLNARNARLYDDPLFTVGIHGYRHPHYGRLSRYHVARELDRAVARFRRVGLPVHWFRPPYGELTTSLPRLLAKRNLQGVLWSLDSYDWRGWRGKRLLQRIRQHLAPGSILLLHDQSLALRELAALIDTIRDEGYEIVPLEELMSYPSRYP
jgi:peptidoglycan/xylan/chitin deacetylase (PgdA/CDA1 family)